MIVFGQDPTIVGEVHGHKTSRKWSKSHSAGENDQISRTPKMIRSAYRTARTRNDDSMVILSVSQNLCVRVCLCNLRDSWWGHTTDLFRLLFSVINCLHVDLDQSTAFRIILFYKASLLSAGKTTLLPFHTVGTARDLAEESRDDWWKTRIRLTFFDSSFRMGRKRESVSVGDSAAKEWTEFFSLWLTVWISSTRFPNMFLYLLLPRPTYM